MLCIVAWAIAHCNVCIDPKKPKFTEIPAISDRFLLLNQSIKSIYYLLILKKNIGILRYKILVCIKLVVLELPSLKELIT